MTTEQSTQDNNTITITADVRAAGINALADDIGAWAKRKGFREDFDDADLLKTYGDMIGEGYISSSREVRDNLYRIAESHRRLANVSKLMLMVSELAEALEGMRDGGNYGEELGDLVIRVLENAQCNRLAIGDEIVKKVVINEQRPYKHDRTF